MKTKTTLSLLFIISATTSLLAFPMESEGPSTSTGFLSRGNTDERANAIGARDEISARASNVNPQENQTRDSELALSENGPETTGSDQSTANENNTLALDAAPRVMALSIENFRNALVANPTAVRFRINNEAGGLSLQALNEQEALNENSTRRPDAIRGDNMDVRDALKAALAAERPDVDVTDLLFVNPMTSLASYPPLSAERLRSIFTRIGDIAHDPIIERIVVPIALPVRENPVAVTEVDRVVADESILIRNPTSRASAVSYTEQNEIDHILMASIDDENSRARRMAAVIAENERQSKLYAERLERERKKHEEEEAAAARNRAIQALREEDARWAKLTPEVRMAAMRSKVTAEINAEAIRSAQASYNKAQEAEHSAADAHNVVRRAPHDERKLPLWDETIQKAKKTAEAYVTTIQACLHSHYTASEADKDWWKNTLARAENQKTLWNITALRHEAEKAGSITTIAQERIIAALRDEIRLPLFGEAIKQAQQAIIAQDQFLAVVRNAYALAPENFKEQWRAEVATAEQATIAAKAKLAEIENNQREIERVINERLATIASFNQLKTDFADFFAITTHYITSSKKVSPKEIKAAAKKAIETAVATKALATTFNSSTAIHEANLNRKYEALLLHQQEVKVALDAPLLVGAAAATGLINNIIKEIPSSLTEATAALAQETMKQAAAKVAAQLAQEATEKAAAAAIQAAAEAAAMKAAEEGVKASVEKLSNDANAISGAVVGASWFFGVPLEPITTTLGIRWLWMGDTEKLTSAAAQATNGALETATQATSDLATSTALAVASQQQLQGATAAVAGAENNLGSATTNANWNKAAKVAAVGVGGGVLWFGYNYYQQTRAVRQSIVTTANRVRLALNDVLETVRASAPVFEEEANWTAAAVQEATQLANNIK